MTLSSITSIGYLQQYTQRLTMRVYTTGYNVYLVGPIVSADQYWSIKSITINTSFPQSDPLEPMYFYIYRSNLGMLESTDFTRNYILDYCQFPSFVNLPHPIYTKTAFYDNTSQLIIEPSNALYIFGENLTVDPASYAEALVTYDVYSITSPNSNTPRSYSP